MGVLYNVYCIRPDAAPARTLRDIVVRLRSEALIEGRIVQGPPLQRERPGLDRETRLVAPDLATYHYETDKVRFRAFDSPEEAADGLVDEAEVAISMTALARGFRRDPAHFYDFPAGLGLYRIPRGHRLVVGAPEDWSDLADEFPELEEEMNLEMNRPAAFDGTVRELFWLHGKNAPLEEDFIGSTLHRTIESLWPGVTVLADAWL